MRNLTIKRADTFAGKLQSYKVYIENYSKGSDLKISGYPCKYLGSIKSGEEKTFEITSEKCRIFVIADKITKDFCNDFCIIPAGQSDITLVGKNNFNPLNFNAFVFEGKPSREMIRNRNANKKIGSVILAAIFCVILIIALIIGCSDGVKKQKFSYDNMQITLTEEFSEAEVSGWEFCYSSKDITVFGKKEAIADYPILEGFNLKEYGSMVLSNTKLDDSVELKPVNDYYYFTYEMQNVGGIMDLTYYVMTFKSDDGFWVMTYSCPSEKVGELSKELFKYADSVKFK